MSETTTGKGSGSSFELFGGTLGEWGEGLAGIGKVVGGISDFRNAGNIQKDLNRQWDLSLGNFANSAQAVNFNMEQEIRGRLANTLGAGPELDAAVAAELAQKGVSTDPYAAQQAGSYTPPSLTPLAAPNMPQQLTGGAMAQPQPQQYQQQPQQQPQQLSSPIQLGAQQAAPNNNLRGRT
jgi:thioredoxin-like negative regulator of GroEL